MKSFRAKFIIFTILLVVAAVLALCNGNIVDFFRNLLNNSDYRAIYWDIRLPRILGAGAAGVLLAAAISNGIKISRQPEFKEVLKKSFFNRHLWKYVCALQFFSLIFAYTLQFPGMDVMAKAGLGGMCYPTMVGSCIVSFTLSSVFILKEKVRKIQMAALVLCILGLILICLPA